MRSSRGLVAVVVAATGLGLPAAALASSAAHYSFVVTGKTVAVKRQGNSFSQYQTLWMNGKNVGKAVFACRQASPTRGWCSATFVLPNGILFARGPEFSSRAKVTNGAAGYTNAHGWLWHTPTKTGINWKFSFST